MPTPSLILVPARFKTGKLYTPVATTSGGVVLGASGDFNVTRATTATRVNASGLIEVVASGIPRLDYPLGGGCPALLVEASGTNLLLRSEEFDDAYWTKDDVTITANTQNAPNNTVDADTITAAATNSGHDINRLVTFTSGVTYSLSCHFKKGTTRYAYIGSASAGWSFLAILDLDTGLISDVTAGATANVVLINGFYRLSLSATATNTASMRLRFGLTSSPTSRGSNLTTSDTIIAWGAQLETGSVATSYIPTTAAAVTRNADVVTLSGAVSGCIGQTEGTIYAEVDISAFVTGKRLVELSNGSAVNRIIISVQGSLIQFLVQNASSTQATIDSATLSAGRFKVAAAYASNDFVFYVNGVKAGEDFIGTVPTLNQINIGSTWNSILQFNDRIRAAALYTTRLTNAELAALTTL